MARFQRATATPAVALLGVLCLALMTAMPADAAARQHRPHSHSHAGRCRKADVPVGHASNPELRAAVLCLINKARARHGLPPLRMSGRLNASAQNWADTMVATRTFGHGNFAARVSAAGFNWSTLGENIATGYSTPRRVVAGWMASADHCKNILSPIYAYVGTGVNRGAISGWASQGGTWAQDFGLKMGQRAPSHNWAAANSCP